MPGVANLCHYPRAEKRKLVQLPLKEDVSIPAYSIYVGDGYMQYEGRGWRGTKHLR